MWLLGPAIHSGHPSKDIATCLAACALATAQKGRQTKKKRHAGQPTHPPTLQLSRLPIPASEGSLFSSPLHFRLPSPPGYVIKRRLPRFFPAHHRCSALYGVRMIPFEPAGLALHRPRSTVDGCRFTSGRKQAASVFREDFRS